MCVCCTGCSDLKAFPLQKHVTANLRSSRTHKVAGVTRNTLVQIKLGSHPGAAERHVETNDVTISTQLPGTRVCPSVDAVLVDSRNLPLTPKESLPFWIRSTETRDYFTSRSLNTVISASSMFEQTECAQVLRAELLIKLRGSGFVGSHNTNSQSEHQQVDSKL